MKFKAGWIYILSLFYLRLQDLIIPSSASLDEDYMFNQYGNGHTILETPYEQASVKMEQQCLSQCVHSYRCLSHEVVPIESGKFQCSLFNVSFQSSKGFKVKQGAKYFSKYFYPKDCASWYKAGSRQNGIYEILINGQPLNVFCEMKENGGGWIVLQKRFNGQVDFNRDWKSYKNGFGNLAGEFWLGNKRLHIITHEEKQNLFVKATSFQNETKRKAFRGFTISSENEKFKIDYDSVMDKFNSPQLFLILKGMHFSTLDQENDNDPNNDCAKEFRGGWWFNRCHQDLMNGVYPVSETGNVAYAQGIFWLDWTQSHHLSLKASELMMRPSNFHP